MLAPHVIPRTEIRKFTKVPPSGSASSSTPVSLLLAKTWLRAVVKLNPSRGSTMLVTKTGRGTDKHGPREKGKGCVNFVGARHPTLLWRH